MGEEAAGAAFAGGSPFAGGGGGGGTRVHFGSPHMSEADAQAFFSQFFGHSDPFGGFGGGFGHNNGVGPSSMFAVPGGGMGGSFNGIPGGMGGGFNGIPGGMSGGFNGMPQQRRRPSMKRYDAIPSGTVVSLKGLVSQPDRNGDRGEIVEFDPSSGRYTVVLEDTDEMLKVKPTNLLQHIHVKIQGIESQPSLNGQRGTIIAWNEQKERYNIYVMNMSKVVGVKPGNVILDNGSVGKIVNVHLKPELNGKFGTIKNWIADTNRYEVQVSKDSIIRIKTENIRV